MSKRDIKSGRFVGSGEPYETAWGYKALSGKRKDGRTRLEHVEIVEAALGHPLPKGVVVHHINEIKTDNRHSNLVVLQNQTEHVELHRKMKVRAAGGDPWRDRLCYDCGPRPASEFRLRKFSNGIYYRQQCNECARLEQRLRARARAEATRAKGECNGLV